jgi:hypothetical protein
LARTRTWWTARRAHRCAAGEKGGGYVVTAFHLLLRLEVTMTDPKAVVDLMLEGPP